MIAARIQAVSLIAPGLDGWQQSQPVLRGALPYGNEPLATFAPELLPRNERRRATGAIKLALRAGEDLVRQYPVDVREIRSVFASSAGDGDIINNICTALARPDRAVSPTQFHNSVHNGPAGYWAIATNCRMASVSLSAHDGGFAAALLEAATIAVVEGGAVMLVAYDYPPPEPLSAMRNFCAPFATAMLISARATGGFCLADLTIEPAHGEREDVVPDETLERLRAGNPAARALPLLHTIAGRAPRRIVLPYLPDMQLAVEVRPT